MQVTTAAVSEAQVDHSRMAAAAARETAFPALAGPVPVTPVPAPRQTSSPSPIVPGHVASNAQHHFQPAFSDDEDIHDEGEAAGDTEGPANRAGSVHQPNEEDSTVDAAQLLPSDGEDAMGELLQPSDISFYDQIL